MLPEIALPFPPLVLRLAARAKKYTEYSRTAHSQHGPWTNSDASTDAEMAAWTTALGLALLELNGDAAADDDKAARKAGSEFLDAYSSLIGRP